jgi:Predicted membrane protein
MATKYDTNPLDPEYPEKAKAAAASGARTNALPENRFATSAFPPSFDTEEQTRRFGENDVSAYSSPYNGQYIPANYQEAGFANMNRSSSRKVAKIGLSENILTALPYLPFSIGLVAGVLELLFVPNTETKVRFHAAQGLAAHIAILIISAVLGIVGNITGSNFGGFLFGTVMTVMLIIFTIKAWKGKPIHIESIDALTNWLEEKITLKSN